MDLVRAGVRLTSENPVNLDEQPVPTGGEAVVEIRLEQFGRAFSTRPRGAELAQCVAELAGPAPDVVLDFTGVLAISYSFADEFVGELEALGWPVAPDVLCAASEVRAVLARTLERRGLDDRVLRLGELVDA